MNTQSKVLVLGAGVSGSDVVLSLVELGHEVFVYDDNISKKDDLPEALKSLDITLIPTINDILVTQYKYVVKSPGIKPDNDAVKLLIQANYNIISDLEIGYIFRNTDNLIAITGTNGKTSTTTLVNSVLNECGLNSSAVGNIGIGVVNKITHASPDDVLVIEASSFQLDNIDTFKPRISVITNITSDHLDYHKTVDNYMNAKMKIIKNQDENDYIVLNWDDAHLREVDTSNVNTIKCSILDELEEGIFLKNDKIVYKNDSLEIEVIDTTKVKLLGKHNIYNIMFVVAVSVIMKIDLNKMAETIYNFQGLEHRLEFVKNISGVNYYNDSKGTNPDSTIKAIDAVEENIVIILGGYDKKIDFTELLEYSKDKVKAIVTVGETKYKIYNKALELGYEEVYVAEEFKEAVLKCKEIAQSGDTVLLSPASASWGMFKS